MIPKNQQYYKKKARNTILVFLLTQIVPICFLCIALLALHNPANEVNEHNPYGIQYTHRPDYMVKYQFTGALDQAAGFFLLGILPSLIFVFYFWKNYDDIQLAHQTG